MTINKLLLFAGIFAALAFGYYKLVIGPKVVLYEDRQVKVWRREPLIGYLRFHSTEPRTMEVLNRRFDNVRGMSPYYLQATNTNLVVFATGTSSQNYIHIMDPAKRRIHSIDADDIGFGGFIGSGRDPGAPATDFIQAISNGVVVLRMTNDKAYKEIIIDLQNDRVKAVNYTEQPN